jgi:hypothetical protein
VLVKRVEGEEVRFARATKRQNLEVESADVEEGVEAARGGAGRDLHRFPESPVGRQNYVVGERRRPFTGLAEHVRHALEQVGKFA